MNAQIVRDFEDTVNQFEKKIHDLKTSRTIAIQTAPQLRLVQNNDKLLADKIQTAIQETIPLWKSQMVMALGLYRQQEALKLQRDITDTTNQLLLQNSEKLSVLPCWGQPRADMEKSFFKVLSNKGECLR